LVLGALGRPLSVELLFFEVEVLFFEVEEDAPTNLGLRVPDAVVTMPARTR
jgi:hypothetical protein